MHSCMIIHYIMEENTFSVIVYKLSVHKKYENTIVKIALKLLVKEGL